MKKICNVTIGRAKAQTANGTLSYAYNLKVALDSFPELVVENISFIDLVSKAGFTFSNISRLKPLIKGEFDLVILHGFYNPVLLIVALLTKARTVLWAPHGSFHPTALLKSTFIKRCFINLASVVIKLKSIEFLCTNKQDVLNTSSVFISAKKHILAPTSGPLEKPFDPYRWVDDGNNMLKVLFLGRYDLKTKGLDTLLKVADLLSKNDNIKFVCHGPFDAYGSDVKAVLRYKSENGLKGNIQFLDAVFGYEKDQVIAACDVFILLSRNEGMPMTVVEALKFGKPAIVTVETNFSPENNNGSLVFVGRDESSVVAELLKLTDQKTDWITKRLLAREYFDLHFGPATVKQKLKDIYERRN